MTEQKRPPVRIRFKYNMDNGEIEEFIIDDSAPTASESYHDGVADRIANQLSRKPQIEDAGTQSHIKVEEPITTPQPAVRQTELEGN